jgi:hypothetical protein
MYSIRLFLNVMRTRKCGALEAQAWLAHKPSNGEFKYNPKDKTNGKA